MTIDTLHQILLYCSLFGLLQMFLPAEAFGPAPRQNTTPKGKRRKGRAKRNAKAKKAKPEKVKPWYVAPPMTAEGQARYDSYIRGRDRIKTTSAGFVPA